MRRPRVSLTLPAIALFLLVFGLVAMRVIPTLVTAEQLAGNILLSAIPFILIFVAILLAYITLIAILSSALNDAIHPRLHQTILRLIIAGIILGILGMFQPWAMALYTNGFTLLLISTLLYIMWSHIRPARLSTAEHGPA